VPEDPDSELVSRVRAGDEGAFAELAGKYHGSMLSIARGYVPSGAVAEEVVQEAWIGVLRGIGRFERRSSFRTWLFRILVNRAISAGVRERRSVPVADIGPVVDASCFDAGGTWQAPPEPWADQVDDQVTAAKISARILAAIDELPLQQREVVTLRDLQVAQRFVDAGFDHLVAMNAGPGPDGFMDFFARELAAPMRALTPAAGSSPDQ